MITPKRCWLARIDFFTLPPGKLLRSVKYHQNPTLYLDDSFLATMSDEGPFTSPMVPKVHRTHNVNRTKM